MAINIVSSSGHVTYGVQEFVVDTESEVQYCPRDCATGSVAFVINNSKAFMLNSNKDWVEI